MNDAMHNDGTPEDDRLTPLVGVAPEVAPSNEARERSRAAFLTGDAEGVAPEMLATKPEPLSRWTWRGPALGLAAAVAGLVWYGFQPAHEWQTLDLSATTAAEHVSTEAGKTFASGELVLALGDELVVKLAPGSQICLPKSPGRWFDKSREIRVTEGAVFCSSGGDELDFDLTVSTADASTRITGTTFAVLRNEHGTCVCLYEGSVEVSQFARDEMVKVPAGKRVQVYEDGSFPRVEELGPEEVDIFESLLAFGK